MALPSPLPDDPRKWDGWSRFDSEDFYERLCLAFETHPSSETIEEHSRQLLVWWQKKLPLKNQPSNPIAQLLRSGLDAAPRRITEARTELLSPTRRAAIDAFLSSRRRQGALAEFQKFLDFALAQKVLSLDAEANLIKLGKTLGLSGQEVASSIHDGLIIAGAAREVVPPIPGSTSGRPAISLLNRPATTKRSTLLVKPREQLEPDEERGRFAPFPNSVGGEMLLVSSGRFLMGSHSPEAPIDEQPATHVTLRRFYISRHPITNAQYEQFDPDHVRSRSPRAGDDHPVVYVSHFDAVKFCEWLSEREGKRYRLPTEAEWEYAARGTDGRVYPWSRAPKTSLAKFTLTQAAHGHSFGNAEPAGQGRTVVFADANATSLGHPLNFAGVRTAAAPVGDDPATASPFGVEDLLGTVWQWCQDYYGRYQGAERMNPQGQEYGTQRVYRGGSWKSRFSSLKATTRGYNVPAYASNDVGFRIVCTCE